MQSFENHQEFLSALDSSLRQAHEQGHPFRYDFQGQRARLDIESLEPAVEFDFYPETGLRGLLVPKLAGELAVVALLPRDDERELFRDYLVVEKAGQPYGVAASNFVMPPLALRFDMKYTPVVEPVLVVSPPTVEELVSR